MLTMGVEEEFFIYDPTIHDLAVEGLPGFELLKKQTTATRGLINGASFGFDHEFHTAILESRTGICHDLNQVRAQIQELRYALVHAASEPQLSVIAAGTLPIGNWRTARIADKPRYAEIAEHYRDVAQRRIICGCHVHIGIADRDVAVQVLNRVQPWLSTLLALSASSPFYEGSDTGYQSFRSRLWGGFPVTGTPSVFTSHKAYLEKIQQLIDTGSILDSGHVYWDARLGVTYDTLEFRIADACTTVGEVILQTGLCRALVLTCLKEITNSRPLLAVEPELMRAAIWRAARSGLDGELIDVAAKEKVAAAIMVGRLLAYLREALEELGDWDEISDLADQIRHRGTSSWRQRQVLTRTGRLKDVVDRLAVETGDVS
jgi:carboxylate-amine ligase